MAKAATDEQITLRRRARRRLIGAMALVTVIAVVLPWVLEREPRENPQDVSIQIPSPDSGSFNPSVGDGKAADKKKPEVPAAKPVPGEAPPAETSPGGDPLKSAQDKLLAPPAPKTATPKDKPAKMAEAAEARKKPEATAEGKQYAVQVTALADIDKAMAIQQELVGKGFKAYTELVKTASGDVTRVRVGPFPNRESAEKERARLKSLGFEGNVTPR